MHDKPYDKHRKGPIGHCLDSNTPTTPGDFNRLCVKAQNMEDIFVKLGHDYGLTPQAVKGLLNDYRTRLEGCPEQLVNKQMSDDGVLM